MHERFFWRSRCQSRDHGRSGFGFSRLTLALGESVHPSSGGPVSQLLDRWQAGDPEALRALVPLVYAELRRLAHRYLQQQRPDHTLQSTALVHEAYLRFAKHEQMRFVNRAHFFAVSARMMRQILVDYARNQHAAKRDAGIKLVLDEAIAPGPLRHVSLSPNLVREGLPTIGERRVEAPTPGSPHLLIYNHDSTQSEKP